MARSVASTTITSPSLTMSTALCTGRLSLRAVRTVMVAPHRLPVRCIGRCPDAALAGKIRVPSKLNPYGVRT